MAPFRNELEASHARIAQLEAEKVDLERRNALLETQLRHRHITVPRAPLAWVGLIPLAMAMLIASMAVLVSMRQRTCRHVSQLDLSHKGVAITPLRAVTPPRAIAPPVIREHPRTAGQADCGCRAGDPLCACIPPAQGNEPGY